VVVTANTHRFVDSLLAHFLTTLPTIRSNWTVFVGVVVFMEFGSWEILFAMEASVRVGHIEKIIFRVQLSLSPKNNNHYFKQ
jgi:hypothetical protein